MTAGVIAFKGIADTISQTVPPLGKEKEGSLNRGFRDDLTEFSGLSMN